MIKVLFVCHGNICRSPMAEFYFRSLVKNEGLEKDFLIQSCATSTEELGNPVHPGTRKKLLSWGISCDGKRARQITKKDFEAFDFLVAMDRRNIANLRPFSDDLSKVSLLLAYVGEEGDVADPWYTGDFDATGYDIERGCKALLEFLRKKYKI